MKRTLVVGLFDEAPAARRVLRALAESPLDLHDVSVLHRNASVQRSLREEAGVPGDRTLVIAAAVGAMLGAATGVLVSAQIPALGPALNAAVGGVLGAVFAVTAAVMASPLKIPPEHRSALAAAIDAGATVVIVRAEGTPTAEAIGDLFRSSGARDLGAVSARPVLADVPDEATPLVATDGAAAETSADPTPDEIFRPPDRRSPVQTAREDAI